MSSVGANLESYFEEQLKHLYPDQTFPDVKAEEPAPAAPAAPSLKDTAETATESPKPHSPEAPVAKDDAEPPNKSPPKEEPPSEEPMQNTEGTEKLQEGCDPENTSKEDDNNKDQTG